MNTITFTDEEKKVNREHVVNFDIRDMLPIVRKAYNDKKLQMFKERPDSTQLMCMYSGPCAIGICIPEELRAHFDRDDLTSDSLLGTSSRSYFENKIFTAPEDQIENINTLQLMHDSCVTSTYKKEENIQKFEDFLVYLEQKYLPQ